jgi:YD repeat-containing protein
MNCGRLFDYVRAGVLVTAVSIYSAASGSGFTAAEEVDFPNTVAGRCAAAYFDAFNSGNNDVMRGFLEKYRSPAYLESHPPKELLSSNERLRGIFGQLTPLRVALSIDLQITLLADASETDDVLVIRFQQESEPPHYIAGVTFSGIDHSKVPDEYVDYVATRAANIHDSLRVQTINAVADLLRDTYVYPDLGGEMAGALMQHLEEGRYDGATKAGKLADMLTEDAVAISHDKHVWVEAQNPMLQVSTDPVNRPVEELRRNNFGFRDVKVLPGNLGLIKFDMILDNKEAMTVAAAALDSLAQCDALIFDIRDNIGGEWGVANLILGYLLPGGTVFGYMYDRDGHRVEESATPDSIPGRPFDAEVPVYVLTSGHTGSAAEGFAYTLKSFDRATIVGEVTLGMAHPSKEVVVNDNFRVSVPYLRSENVVTGTSFQGTGVTPQIRVAADGALDAAVEDAVRRIDDRD